MCTRVLWPDAADAVLVGRTMDYPADIHTALWKLPRGAVRDDGLDGSLSWTSRHGSVVTTGFDLATLDGVNEAGLGGHLLLLSETTYGERDPARTGLAVSVWLQYYLDNFATVADAVSWTRDSQVQIDPLVGAGDGSPVTLHLALEDAGGDSAIVEYLDGEARIWHDPAHRVLTNSPPFDQQVAYAKRFAGLGGDDPLPGSSWPPDRYARAMYYLDRLPEPASQADAVASIMSVVRNVAQPFRRPRPGHPDAAQTAWQTVADLTRGRYVFESTRRPNIVWVDLADLDFSPGAPTQKLDLTVDLAIEGGIAGEVAGDFVDVDAGIRFLSRSMLAALQADPAP